MWLSFNILDISLFNIYNILGEYMENYISAIEISDTEIRLAVGYVRENKINLIHVAQRPIIGLVSHGDINDFQTLSSIIASMKEFKDETTKEKITINEASLVLHLTRFWPVLW